MRPLLAAAALAALLAAGCGGAHGGATPPLTASADSGVRATDSTPPKLGSYKIDFTKTMASGVSSGGYEAVQLQIAYAKSFHGSAIFAAGPYYCAEDSETIALDDCTENYGPTELPTLEQETINTAAYGYNDPISYIKGQKSWLFSGTQDTTVYSSIVKDLNTYLKYFGVTTSTNFTTAAGHAWISPDATTACGTTASPYLNNCGFDAEQTFLTYLYGTLTARRVGALTGTLKTFSQNEFLPGGNAAAYDMDSTGYVYVPASCASGTTCKIMVALHGCAQGASTIGTAFVTNSGLWKRHRGFDPLAA